MLSRIEEEQKLLVKTKDHFFTNKYNLSQYQTAKIDCRTLNGDISILGHNKYLKSINSNTQMGIKRSETWKMSRADGLQED